MQKQTNVTEMKTPEFFWGKMNEKWCITAPVNSNTRTGMKVNVSRRDGSSTTQFIGHYEGTKYERYYFTVLHVEKYDDDVYADMRRE